MVCLGVEPGAAGWKVRLKYRFRYGLKWVIFSCESLCSFIKSVTCHVSEKTIRNYISSEKDGKLLHSMKSLWSLSLDSQHHPNIYCAK